jgi:hypothetical protein
MDYLQGDFYFTKMELIVGYHQVHMSTIDTWKKTFKKNFGLFEWLVMPFGLTNALATFMQLINDIFWPHLGKFLVISLDYILIFRKSLEEHIQYLILLIFIILFYYYVERCTTIDHGHI